MTATYEWLPDFAQLAGMLGSLLFCLAVLVYALWPRNRERFDDAARMPLRED
jgi:cytochrome c oxidase cbb3-type subunit IV